MQTTSDYTYDLPEELIAQYPLEQRTASRLLCLGATTQSIQHQQFSDVIELLAPGDLLVLNDTLVIPARVYGAKASGGKIECLIERVISEREALAHIKASKSPKAGSELILAGDCRVRVLGREGDLFHLQFLCDDTLLQYLQTNGHMPLPPYIDRNDEALDLNRYQTVFAKQAGAVAAPTAGLHFDEEMLQALREKGVHFTTVTLHVGAGTFQPVRVESLDDHVMHQEFMVVNEAVVEAVAACRQRNGRVVAVGTTAVRALESASRSGQLQPFTGETQLFIRPGFEFHCVDALITNFHLPQSTLLMLVCAFAGFEFMLQAYREAVAARYRFFSYGDAMFISHS